jgi:hypothetical protein
MGALGGFPAGGIFAAIPGLLSGGGSSGGGGNSG